MTDVTSFYNLSHIFISGIGAALLIAIWYNIKQRFSNLLEENQSKKRVDKGLLYLSFAMLVWVASGCWTYFGNSLSLQKGIGFQLGINLLSIINNLFLLLALFYFYYAPKFIYNNIKNIKIIIAIIIVTSLLTFGLSNYLGTNNISNGIKISGIPDVILSVFLCWLLAVSFYKTFIYRGLRTIAFISIAVILLVFVSQLSDVFIHLGNEFSNNFVKIIAKTSFICICLVLATTWVIRLASMPKPNEMNLKFLDWGLVTISIPTKGVINQTIDFKSKTTQYKNLLKFAIRRKYGEGNSQSILVSSGGEIKSQTYLTRIIDNINVILELDDHNRLERRDLLTFIGEGNYRLRMLPNNITIDTTLLEEFNKNTENQTYSVICN